MTNPTRPKQVYVSIRVPEEVAMAVAAMRDCKLKTINRVINEQLTEDIERGKEATNDQH